MSGAYLHFEKTCQVIARCMLQGLLMTEKREKNVKDLGLNIVKILESKINYISEQKLKSELVFLGKMNKFFKSISKYKLKKILRYKCNHLRNLDFN